MYSAICTAKVQLRDKCLIEKNLAPLGAPETRVIPRDYETQGGGGFPPQVVNVL